MKQAEYISFQKHVERMRKADQRVEAERDRRYSEVNTEREKALKIKEEADKVALDLARQIQTYKDEKANQLREQISSERGDYASKEDIANLLDKMDAVIKPLQAWQSKATGAVLVLMLAAGTFGALIGKAFGG